MSSRSTLATLGQGGPGLAARLEAQWAAKKCRLLAHVSHRAALRRQPDPRSVEPRFSRAHNSAAVRPFETGNAAHDGRFARPGWSKYDRNRTATHFDVEARRHDGAASVALVDVDRQRAGHAAQTERWSAYVAARIANDTTSRKNAVFEAAW